MVSTQELCVASGWQFIGVVWPGSHQFNGVVWPSSHQFIGVAAGSAVWVVHVHNLARISVVRGVNIIIGTQDSFAASHHISYNDIQSASPVALVFALFSCQDNDKTRS